MKQILTVFLILSTSLYGELIPASRLGSWGAPGVGVGVIGGIPTNRTTILNVTNPIYAGGAVPNDSGDDAPAIQAAINAATAGQIVFIPAGTYRTESTLAITTSQDNITLRGAGMGVTILDHRGSARCIGVGEGTGPNYAGGDTVTSSLTKGNTTLTIADASGYAVGNVMNIGFSDRTGNSVIQAGGIPIGMGNPFSISAGSAGNLRQVVRITAKAGNTITFFPAIQSHTSDLNAKVWYSAVGYSEGVGIEDLTIDCTSGTSADGILMSTAVNCWFKNVKSIKPGNYPITVTNCVNVEVRKCWASDLRVNLGPASNSAGILLHATTASLFEDNIVYKVFPGWEINYGTTDCVFAYNYVDMDGIGHSGINTNHGPHNAFNLYEGNVTTSFQADGYFGGVSEDTIFRNWMHAREGYALTLKRFTRQYNIVGNITGRPGVTGGYDFGFPHIGNAEWTGEAQPTAGDFWVDWPEVTNLPNGFDEKDLDVEPSCIIKGNYVYMVGQESTGGDTIPNSLYLSAKPTWFGNLTWPPVNPATGTVSDTMIPAGYRYINGVDPPPDGSGSVNIETINVQNLRVSP